MSLHTLHIITWAWMALALAVFVTMHYITAPFGRHSSRQWGPVINNKLGWFIMELPSLGIMGYYLVWGSRSMLSYVWILFACWIFHYLHRTLIYPLRIRATEKKMPVFIVVNAIVFNLINAGLNGYYLAELADPMQYNADWLRSPSFIAGAILFVGGMGINLWADTTLINLRRPGQTGYTIPRGFLFEYITAPNLFGEIIEWTGFAVMAWNLPATSFMVWTMANLIPRARNHHQWYLRHFEDYPKDRKMVLPGLY